MHNLHSCTFPSRIPILDVVATSSSSTVSPFFTKHFIRRLSFMLEKNVTISDIQDWRELTSFVDPPPNSLQCINLYVSW